MKALFAVRYMNRTPKVNVYDLNLLVLFLHHLLFTISQDLVSIRNSVIGNELKRGISGGTFRSRVYLL